MTKAQAHTKTFQIWLSSASLILLTWLQNKTALIPKIEHNLTIQHLIFDSRLAVHSSNIPNLDTWSVLAYARYRERTDLEKLNGFLIPIAVTPYHSNV